LGGLGMAGDGVAGVTDYDPQKDAIGSYYAAIEAKRQRLAAAIKREVVIGDARLIQGDASEIVPLLGGGHGRRYH
jgi:hypothetical protein